MRVFEHRRDGGRLIAAARRLRQQEAPRTGLHVSTICDDFIKVLQPPRKTDFAEPVVLMFQDIGNAVENAIARELRRMYFPHWHKPTEPLVDADGVIGSPDGVDDRSLTIDEMKATWVSEHEFIEIGPGGKLLSESVKFMRYRMQAMKYAHMKGPEWRRIRLHVVFMRGERFSQLPVPPREFVLTFSQDESDRNAALLRQHAVDKGWLQ